MTERDIGRVEKALGVRLPAHYRRFLAGYGTAVARLKREGAFVPLFTAAKDIIEANAALRADPARQPTNRDRDPWPLRYLVVGADGAGDYWCVDLTGRRETVWRFDSEAGGVFRPADPPTWAGYLERLRTPVAAEPGVWSAYVCKKGAPGTGPAGDGSFAVTDGKGRAWACYEQRERTPEELLALVRGEFRTPDWLGDKGARHLSARSREELRAALTKER